MSTQADVEEIDFQIVSDELNADKNGAAKTIYVEPGKQEKAEPTKQKIDFLSDDFTANMFSKPSVDAGADTLADEAEFEDKEGVNIGADRIRFNADSFKEDEKVLQPEEILSVEDFQDTSEFVLELFDTGVSNLCCAISGTTNASDYSVSDNKKRKLAKQLSAILHKHKLRMSLEFMFVVSLCLVYMQPVKQAVKIRREKKKAKKMAEVNQQKYENNKVVSEESTDTTITAEEFDAASEVATQPLHPGAKRYGKTKQRKAS